MSTLQYFIRNFFGFINESDNLNKLQNHILLIFRLYVYQSRERGILNLNGLIKKVTKVKKLERKIASVCKKKTIQFNNKKNSTDISIRDKQMFNLNMYVLRNCFEFFFVLFIIVLIFLHILGWVGRNFSFSFFFNFTSKLVVFIILKSRYNFSI